MTRTQKRNRSDIKTRIVLGVVCVSLIFVGVRVSLGGGMSYKNYFGGVVFGPFAVLMGAFGLVLVLFKRTTLDSRPKKLKGRAARKARQARRYRSSVEDFDRPWTGGL